MVELLAKAISVGERVSPSREVGRLGGVELIGGHDGSVSRLAELTPDCGRCAGLCCVALPFSASADFAIDKGAGEPCPNLQHDFGCGIHGRLRVAGFPACTAFDCLGAGQRVTQVTFGGPTWRDGPVVAAAMFEAFAVVRQLHEIRWHLDEVAALAGADGDTDDAGARALELAGRVDALADGDADALRTIDLDALRAEGGVLLRDLHAARRAAVLGPADEALDLAGADLLGADLRERDLRGAQLRGALLVGADLRGTDLAAASCLGADLRGADLRGADLGGALFLTPMQVGAARGDGLTRLPARLTRPAHW